MAITTGNLDRYFDALEREVFANGRKAKPWK